MEPIAAGETSHLALIECGDSRKIKGAWDSYDNRNRLANLGVATGSANLFGYNYTLDAAGHRTSVTELSGRTVNYSYDNLYRLTSETIVGDANRMTVP
jgi:YD repeat-containing protein